MSEDCFVLDVVEHVLADLGILESRMCLRYFSGHDQFGTSVRHIANQRSLSHFLKAYFPGDIDVINNFDENGESLIHQFAHKLDNDLTKNNFQLQPSKVEVFGVRFGG